jgi:hypothetical protein
MTQNRIASERIFPSKEELERLLAKDVRQLSSQDKPSAEGSQPGLANKESLLVPTKFIAWLGASAGGLTIFLLAVGFLAHSAHDAMLGVPRAIHNNSEYVVVGGLFLGRSVIFLVAACLLHLWKSLLILAALLVMFTLSHHSERYSGWLYRAFISVCILALLCAEFYTLVRLTRPLQISNLLLSPSANPKSPATEVVRAILENDTSWLAAEYGFLVLLVLAQVVVIRLIDGQRERRDHQKFLNVWRWSRVPALALLFICIFLLPRAYGVMTISNDFLRVEELTKANPAGSNLQSPSIFLLREDENNILLYDPSNQSMSALRRDPVGYRILAPENVFSVLAKRP